MGMHAANSADWISVREAASQIGIKPGTFRRHLETGVIGVTHVRFGRVIRMKRPEWVSWLEQHTHNAKTA